MIRHLLLLTWRRRRASALVLAEIFVAFLVMLALGTLGAQLEAHRRAPLGFAWQDLWRVRLQLPETSDDRITPGDLAIAARLLREVRTMPEVAAAAAAMDSPYSQSRRETSFEVDGRRVESEFDEVSDGFGETLQMHLVAGRWFGPEDDGSRALPIIVNEHLAREIFGAGDAVGKTLPEREEGGRVRRVVGVLSDYRKQGEYQRPGSMYLERKRLDDPTERAPRTLLLRMRAGSGVEAEQRIAERLHALAPDWSFKIETVARMRERTLAFYRAPLLVAGLVAASLMAMVALGLLGVLWQSVARRTQEIGLRRVHGATAMAVCRQVLGEVLVLCTLAAAAGTAVAVQAPLLGLWNVPRHVMLASLGASLLALYVLGALSALYPAWLAARVQPAAALRDE